MAKVKSDVDFEIVDPSTPIALQAMGYYFAELSERFPHGFDVVTAMSSSLANYVSPLGMFLVAHSGGEVVGCGAVQWLDDSTGEIKRMWIAKSARGVGLGSRMLENLELLISDTGRTRAVLDTNKTLVEAIAMYRRHGYTEIEEYNDNPDAELWFEKSLDGVAKS